MGGVSRALGKGGGQTVQTNSAPWGPTQPYLRQIFGEGQRLYNQGPMQYFPGQTVAPQSANTQRAIADTAATSTDPNSLTNAARDETGRTVRGDYLRAETNPYLEQAVSRALGQTRGAVNANFGRGGGNNFGSSAHEELLTRNLADTALPYYFNNYQAERGRQTAATAAAPGMDIAATAGVRNAGIAQDAYQQALIDAQRQRYEFNQQSPWDSLQRYQASVTGTGGGSQESPFYGANPLANAVGTAASAAGIYGMGRDYGWWGHA